MPDAEQRVWRAVSRRKNQLTQDKVRLRGQLEGLLEEAHIKLTSLVGDRPSDLPTHLEDPAPGGPVPGAGAVGERQIEEREDHQNDPRATQFRLPSRCTPNGVRAMSTRGHRDPTRRDA